MKLKFILASGLVLSAAAVAYFALSPHHAFADGESNLPQKENPTVKSFIKEFKDSNLNLEEIFSGTSDNDKIIRAPEGGYYFSGADANPIIAETQDKDGNSLPGTELNLNSKDATTVGELKKALQDARK